MAQVELKDVNKAFGKVNVIRDVELEINKGEFVVFVEQHGGFSDADQTWLPVAEAHLHKAGLDEAERTGSIYTEFAAFLRWRKTQPALVDANQMGPLSGGPRQIIFDRLSDQQTLRCCFDFDTLTASFEEI